MVLDIELINVAIKPVFNIRIPGKRHPIQALFDTGSTKVIWCSAKTMITETNFQETRLTTSLSGFGTGEQTGCKIYKGSFSIYKNGKGITFKDVEIVESTKKLKAFDMILPYMLFNKFEYTFKPSAADTKFGKLIIDTLDHQIIHRTRSSGGTVSEVYCDFGKWGNSKESF